MSQSTSTRRATDVKVALRYGNTGLTETYHIDLGLAALYDGPDRKALKIAIAELQASYLPPGRDA